ncbi:MAG TPA: amino acid adenylation domain-containing protein [Blastocatellia bacterium]|nr:amino acid adenylation domain-containing protein [Blastocatellia bacterium]
MTTAREEIERRRGRLAMRRASLPSEKQAALLGRLQVAAPEDSRPGSIPPRPPDQPIPLSFAQERLWIWDQLNPGSVTYNISLAGQISGRLNVSAMSQALNEVIRRHESLRTNFVSEDGQAVQVIAAARQQPLPTVDLEGLSEPEQEAVTRRLAAEEARRPYDLAEDSLLRVSLIKNKRCYAVLRTMHHIVSDLWSGEIFMRELGMLYQTYGTGMPSPMADLPIQFADYSHWQRQWLQGDVLAGELAYWKQQLEGIQALDLPTDRRRSDRRTYRAATEGLTLSAELTEGLRALSQREGVTLFVVLLAALKVLLCRHSGQQDIAVGTVLAGRSRIETEPLIGFFLNTVVMRSKLPSDMTIREAIGHVREVFLGAQAHQDLPFERLIEELKPERSLSYAPLFQVMFSMSSAPPAADQKKSSPFAELRFSGLAGKQQAKFDEAKFDLTVTMAEMPDRIGVSFEYNTDLFDATTVQRMVRHYATLLTQAVADPDLPLVAVEVLSAAEKHRLLIEWNQAVGVYRRDRCLSEVFEAQVAQTPEAIAIEDDERQLTYGELNRRANQLANYLRGFQAGAESFVGICMPRSVDLVVAILGTLKAGAAFIPMDPSQPDQRLRFLIEDSGAALVLSLRRLAGRIPAERAQAICLDTDWQLISEAPSSNLDSPAGGDNAAYVIYTSGSTGTPKGVVASHTATLNRLEWMWAEHPFQPGDICCQKTIISFVDSIFETLGPLLQGVRLSIIPEEAVKDPTRLIRNLGSRQVTHIVLVPSLLRMLFESGQELATQIPALRFWVTSGEYFSPDLAEAFQHRLPRRELLNSYGASEVAADVTYFNLKTWRGGTSPVAIGHPISSTSVYLLDRNANPCPLGAHGELYVGGLAPARGYLGKPDLTADRFVPDHLGGVAGGRLYRTGDIARCLPDGGIEYLGRRDFQVKIRGFRIELGEIETALSQHPDVEQAVVIAGDSQLGDPRLRAYVVARPGVALADKPLISYLKERLPDYMVPAGLVIVERLPLTPNGKVDRIALAKMAPAATAAPGQETAPRTLLEMQLMQMWEKVLGVASVGVRDNFFSLGGTSMSAVRLASQIEKQFGQRLTLNVLMQEGNIANLAKLLQEKVTPRRYSPLVALHREGSRPPLFFVHAIGGEVLEYYQLARLLGDDQPFYALQAPLGAAPVDDNRSLEEVATRYLDAIREVQPAGPYWLGGFSWGGAVAFEMAQQLTRQNQPVGLLALVDSVAPWSARVKPRHEDEAVFLLKALQALAPAEERDLFVREEGLASLNRVELYSHALERLQRWGLIAEGLERESGLAYLSNYVKGYMSRIKAFGEYEAKVYPGKITLFQVESETDREAAWSRLSSEPLSLREIAGPHWTVMREPQVRVLAQQMRDCLEEAAALLPAAETT